MSFLLHHVLDLRPATRHHDWEESSALFDAWIARGSAFLLAAIAAGIATRSWSTEFDWATPSSLVADWLWTRERHWFGLGVARMVRMGMVLLHGIGAVMLLVALARRGARLAWVATALFAVHPLAVGALAIATAQTQALSLCLTLGAILLYQSWRDREPDARPAPGPARFLMPALYLGTAGACFLLAAALHPIAAVLPALLLVRSDPPDARFVVPGTIVIGIVSWIALCPVADLFPKLLALPAITFAAVRSLVLGPGPVLAFPVPSLLPAIGGLLLIAAIAAAAVRFLPRSRLPILGFLGLASCVALFGSIRVGDEILLGASQFYLVPLLAALAIAAELHPWIERACRTEVERVETPQALASGSLLLAIAGVLAASALGRPKAPGEAWPRLASANPSSPSITQRSISYLEKRGDVAGALAAARAAPGDDPALQIRAGQLALKSGDLDAARRSFETVLEHDPDSTEARLGLVEAHAQAGHLEESRAILDAARAPADPSVLNSRGVLLAREGKIDEAIATFREALEQDPKRAATLINLANLLNQTGKIEEAAGLLATAVRAHPDDFVVCTATGMFFVSHERWDDAERVFRRAVQMQPQNAAAYTNLGNVLASQGKKSEAIFLFQQALRYNDRFEPAKYGLSQLEAPATVPAN